MFAPAYVILPFSPTPPAEALRRSLAPFERGGRGDLPDDALAFHDETEHVRELHGATYTFTQKGKGGIEIRSDVDTFILDLDPVRQEMARRSVESWGRSGSRTRIPTSMLSPRDLSGAWNATRSPAAMAVG